MFDRRRPADCTDSGRNSEALPPSRAILLCGGEFSPAERNLATLLDFFGIPWKTSRPGELAERADSIHDAAGGYCVLSTAPSLAESLQSSTAENGNLPPWLPNARSVYVVGFRDSPRCLELLRYLSDGGNASIQNAGGPKKKGSMTRDL